MNKKETKISKDIKINKKTAKRNYSNQAGITLIVLVVTIVVLLILAGVTLNALFNENGILTKSKNAGNIMEDAKKSDLNAINDLDKWIDEKTGNGGKEDPTEKPKITDSSLTSDDRTNTDSKTVIAKDEKENQVVVPGGFKIADDSGDTVEKGVVIEDKDGNQFVWIPVSNTNNDGSNKIIKDDGTPVEITLGRYTFKREKSSTTNLYEDGTPKLVQKGSEYAAVTAANVADGTVNTDYLIGSYYYELSDKSRPSNELKDLTGTNTTAKNLKDFIEKTETNKGFYIARYEASYGSGYNKDGKTTAEKYGNAKPLSKVSTANSTSSMNYEQTGTLWNFISQPQAAIVSQNMYKNDKYVESDLVNSYAWDTAIVYIQEMENTNYANANRDTTGNTSLKNTGKTEDQVCKIFDMAGNTDEWTTEYSTDTNSSFALPCTCRGGSYGLSICYTSSRDYFNATSSNNSLSFRPLLYVK